MWAFASGWTDCKKQAKKIYSITARHDYAENPCEFIGDRTVPVAGMERSDLREFYREFGFDDAIAEHRASLMWRSWRRDCGCWH